jgi:hypothetical protein
VVRRQHRDGRHLRSIIGVVIFCVVLQLIAVPVLWRVRQQMRAMAQV